MLPEQANEHPLPVHQDELRRGTLLTGLYLLVVVAAIVVYFNVHTVGSKDLVNLINSWVAVVVIFAAIRWHRPERRWAWYALAGGTLMSAIGNLLWTYYEVVLAIQAPLMTVADVVFLLGRTLVAVGLYNMTKTRNAWHDRVNLVDAGIITTGLSVLSWVFLIEPAVQTTSHGWFSVLVATAYPIETLLLVVMLVRFVLNSVYRVPSFYLLLVGLGATLLSDTGYTITSLNGTYYTGHPMDIGWFLYNSCLAAAALHPSMRYIAGQTNYTVPRLTAFRLLLLAFAGLIPSIILTVQYFRGEPYNVLVYVASTVALIFLAATRYQGLMDALNKNLDEVSHIAFYDALTQVANRRLFNDRLSHALTRRAEPNHRIAVLFIDIDGFKQVNELAGYEIGDQLLIETASRIQNSIRAQDTVARYGTDEFLVLLEGMTTPDEAEAVTTRIHESLSYPYLLADYILRITSSIGTAVATAETEHAGDLVRDAQEAMEAGRTTPRVHSSLPSMMKTV